MERGHAGSRQLIDLDATRDLGQELAALVEEGDILLLVGELGSGKTSFTQGLAKGLGISESVTSPTFALCNVLGRSRVLHHYDLYRLKNTHELVEIGFEESLEANVVVVVEWPLPALDLLFGEVLLVRMCHTEQGRFAEWHWQGAESLCAEDLQP